KREGLILFGTMATVLALASWTSGKYPLIRPHSDNPEQPAEPEVVHLWSPYYRIDYEYSNQRISVNQIGHQEMISRTTPHPAYSLPYLFNRDSGGHSLDDVLIIGAGSGNDVSRALEWGARHVDAVEIDPVIQRLGEAHHPDNPYQDTRVTVHLDDGRNFLRSTSGKYDLIVYALVDSLV